MLNIKKDVMKKIKEKLKLIIIWVIGWFIGSTTLIYLIKPMLTWNTKISELEYWVSQLVILIISIIVIVIWELLRGIFKKH